MSGLHPADGPALYGDGPGKLVRAQTDSPSGAIICLHGVGDNRVTWASKFPLPSAGHLFTVLPTAHDTPVTSAGGLRMPSWFDLYGPDTRSRDGTFGIAYSVSRIHSVVEAVSAHVPTERIVLMGFSQGGALALAAGLSCTQKLAAIVALSAWLPMRDSYPAALSEHAKNTPVFVGHGELDELVQPKFGQLSANTLKDIGLNVTFEMYEGMSHSSSPAEIRDVAKFVTDLVPSASTST